MGTKKFVHEAASEGTSCTNCHEVDKEGIHSFALVAEGAELCAECHDPKGDKEYIHSPVEEGECTSCHDPHQSDNPEQLVLPPSSELCFSCHDEDISAGTITHEPVREGKCLSCHDPHSTDNPKQLTEPVPDLCVTCHGIEMVDQKGVFISSKERLFEENGATIHKPFRDGECLKCHSPHNSKNHRLLKRSYPTTIYSKYSDDAYDLCLGCHKKMVKALNEPRTLTDTNFRNGNLNLHYRHVNKKKGRSCKSCHHHHGTKNEKLIRRTFHFGTMELILEYDKTETGGACASSCHLPVEYDRYKPAKTGFKTSPREGKDATPLQLENSRKQKNSSK